jgi:hypothetical protein
MSPDEARDVQTVLRALLLEEHDPDGPDLEAAFAQARSATIRLAAGAFSLIGDGLTGAEAGRLWDGSML